ncbi:MAG: IPT/TIG domain-containing protein [Dysgonamonadaceae bacterium]|nr:IPT/TIG domain-containing protein [Dysgonamonadaceae bacterium]
MKKRNFFKCNWKQGMIALFAGFIVLTNCKEETFSYQQQVLGKPYDPNLPVEITGFTPDSGKIREKIVITGSNFGNDKEQVQVFFNDGVSDRKAIVLNVDGTSVYCLVPRQLEGRNRIKVAVSSGAPVMAANTFHYEAAANVSWVTGLGLQEGVSGQNYKDGTLAEARFWKIHGIVALGDEQIMTFGFHESDGRYVRFISVKDDRVTTVQSGIYLGKPAINEAKTRVYVTTVNPPHVVYEYRKESGWMPYYMGEITKLGDSPNNGIRTLVMMDKAHDPNQEWLYFCHIDKFFGRFNINTLQTEVLGEELDLPKKKWPGYLVYDNIKDCFYLSLYEFYSIYRISKTGASWTDGVQAELFAGSPSQSAVVNGMLEDARFKGPKGMCMDEDGNIYVCEGHPLDEDAWNDIAANVIRKISVTDGYVSTIAGTLGVWNPIKNGAPLESVLFMPQDITYDGEGNFYIAEWWEASVRKYAVE